MARRLLTEQNKHCSVAVSACACVHAYICLYVYVHAFKSIRGGVSNECAILEG